MSLTSVLTRILPALFLSVLPGGVPTSPVLPTTLQQRQEVAVSYAGSDEDYNNQERGSTSRWTAAANR